LAPRERHSQTVNLYKSADASTLLYTISTWCWTIAWPETTISIAHCTVAPAVACYSGWVVHWRVTRVDRTCLPAHSTTAFPVRSSSLVSAHFAPNSSDSLLFAELEVRSFNPGIAMGAAEYPTSVADNIGTIDWQLSAIRRPIDSGTPPGRSDGDELSKLGADWSDDLASKVCFDANSFLDGHACFLPQYRFADTIGGHFGPTDVCSDGGLMTLNTQRL
jgi:hypothetical protein